MENKINIAELLRDCPKGMELDCTTWENVTFEEVKNNNIIIRRNNKEPYFDTKVNLNQYGCCTNYSDEKCRIFPKGKTTWVGFVPPCQFKDGDILTSKSGSIFILKEPNENNSFYGCYIAFDLAAQIVENCTQFCAKKGCRFTTEEEKQKLFDAIKANGYRWNAETKTLEELVKPKFKVGDRIRHKEKTRWACTISRVEDRYYVDGHPMCYTLPLGKQNEYELVPNKFDINTFKPFDKVLVRDNNAREWVISFFSHCNGLEIYKYSCINGSGYAQCIPYTEDTKHLLGTTNDCDDFYKTWEK